MIARRQDMNAPSKFKKLAEYIAAAKETGEKLENLWIVNSHAGKDLESLPLSIIEIDAQQAKNTTAKTNKSYHLIVSFRDEHPTPEALKDIEQEFAKALGFQDHPRVIGTHVNTENFHMHVGYSRIHPTTFKAHTPSHDFRALEKVSRAMEKKYDLKVDIGKADKIEKNLMPIRAKDKERQTWEESFFTYSQRHKQDIDERMKDAKTWQDVHNITLEYGIEVKPHGAGLTLKNINGDESVKASSLGRDYTKKQLEAKFGEYVAPQEKALKLAKNVELKEIQEAPALASEPIFQNPKENIENYVESQKKFIELDLSSNKTWQSLHEATREYGLEFKKRGAGIVIKSIASNETIKASTISRDFSLKRMEEKFGVFTSYEVPGKTLSKIQKNKDEISIDIKHSSNWETLHKRMDTQGFAIKKLRNGYFIQDKTAPSNFVKVSEVDKNLNTARIEEKLGSFKPMDRTRKQQPIRYARKPIIKHPRLPFAWQRYIGAKKATPSLAGRAYKSWKQFLMADALNDPMAMAIIHMQNKVINDLLGPKPKAKEKLQQIGLER